MTIIGRASETAYKGYRWGDLVRVALQRNDLSFLANKIYDKLRKDNVPSADAIKSRLMNPQNWYLPFKC